MKEMRKKGRGRGEIPLFFSLSLYPHPTPPSTPATQATPTDTGVFGLVLHFSQSLGFLWISVLKLRFWFFVKVNWFQSHLAF